VDAAPVPQALRDAASTGINFEKGVYEGAYQGVKELAGAARSAGEMASGAALLKGAGAVAAAAVSADARTDLLNDVTDDVKKLVAVGNTAANPIGSAITTGAQIVSGYESAAAKGQAAEFLGKGVGDAGVKVLAAGVGGETEAGDLVSEAVEGAVQGLGADAEPKASEAAGSPPVQVAPVPADAAPTAVVVLPAEPSAVAND
jgi:hypothetical protein